MLALLLLSILCRIYAGYLFEEKKSSFYIDEKEIAFYLAQLDSLENLNQKKTFYKPSYKSPFPEAKLFAFDPNSISQGDWEKLGFSSSQANSIVKYRTMIGGFQSPDQMKECFVISDKKFNELKPYIKLGPVQIAASERSKKKEKESSEVEEMIKPDLNFSDVSELILIKGIAEYSAKKIIDYRNILGGFSDLDQLYEVRGLDSSRVEILKNASVLNPKIFRRIDINMAEFMDLRKHPYIDDDLARLIVRYRELHGKYQSVESLKKLALVNESKYKQISPYLKVQ